ncbi:MAG: hypothetical protein SVS85_02385, partial [Candidatus Nanohaloarchaea archaeon]|nr:hypothetical protein [Candidatus Nanohaloarchaea archaeon]
EEHVVQDGEVKTHGELRRQEKFKPGQCNICKYEDGCEGIWKDYFEEMGEKEVMPVTGKVVLTDNERCMVSILMEEKKASTKTIMELKSSERFKDVCANCVGSDDVILTGNNLREKDVVDRVLEEDGYLWSLNEGSDLVKKLGQTLEA